MSTVKWFYNIKIFIKHHIMKCQLSLDLDQFTLHISPAYYHHFEDLLYTNHWNDSERKLNKIVDVIGTKHSSN